MIRLWGWHTVRFLCASCGHPQWFPILVSDSFFYPFHWLRGASRLSGVSSPVFRFRATQCPGSRIAVLWLLSSSTVGISSGWVMCLWCQCYPHDPGCGEMSTTESPDPVSHIRLIILCHGRAHLEQTTFLIAFSWSGVVRIWHTIAF